jgi:hypothetical protein
MAGAGRLRAVLRWPAGFAALVMVLAVAGSGSAQAGPPDEAAQAGPLDEAALFADCRRAAEKIFAEYRYAENVSVGVVCTGPDGDTVDPKLWLPAPPVAPAPTPATTVGHAGCVTGPGRPVVGTVLTTASATARRGDALLYEFQQLDGGETVNTSGSLDLEFGPGDLAPGVSYRWRARVDDIALQSHATGPVRSLDEDEMGWSPWCEFTVSADAVDYRELGDVSLEALNELGLRPDRKYPVTLSRRQQRLLREATDVGRTSARMTLTGPRWTDLLVQLSEEAFIADEVAAELAGEDSPPPDGTAYRRLMDAISVKLGGPAHLDFG